MAAVSSNVERSARMSALGQYFRWLLKYYGSAELAEMADESDPVSLRQIFVPMRVSLEDLAESSMAGPEDVVEKETEADLPGMDAFELIQRERFVCLSGLPGSGKTTLVKALIGELCGQHPSPLRNALAGTRGIAPVPLILREFPGLDQIYTLDDLMEAWWQKLEKQAKQGDSLDIPRLRECFSPHGDDFPQLLLFDGIDETGGEDIRRRIIEIACECYNHGYLVIVTGRPSGFDKVMGSYQWTEDYGDIRSEGILNPKLFKLLPLAWPQIQTFIQKWYRLRPEWEIKRIESAAHFLEALQDNNRAYLLSLARRPIFLTLMALVHCTRNEMPHGRAELYEAIVDLYLNRQERHRQLRFGIHGKPLRAWPPLDKRRVLGHIAYQSQIRGSEREKARENPDSRRILWPRTELVALIREYLENRSSFGIAAEEAEDLLNYFLHPAGLLVEPREGEISFAHLSFQEYLCAEDIQRRLTGRKFVETFRNELIAWLDKPGWDEVGLLLLVIQKNQSDDGHLELLELLLEDQQNPAAAGLFVRAWCGQELGFSTEQRLSQLENLVSCCIEHPELGLAQQFRAWTDKMEQIGLKIVIDKLCKIPDEAKLNGLLSLIHDSNWGCCDGGRGFVSSAELVQAIETCMQGNIKLVVRESDNEIPAGLVKNTNIGRALDIILPPKGALYQSYLTLLPVDFWLLTGEYLSDFSNFFWLSLYPTEALPPRTKLALKLYSVSLLAQLSGFDSFALKNNRIASMLSLRMNSIARLAPKRSEPTKPSYKSNNIFWMIRDFSIRLLVQKAQLISYGDMMRPFLYGSMIPTFLGIVMILFENLIIIQNLSTQLSRAAKQCDNRLKVSNLPEMAIEKFSRAFEYFGYKYASHNWFLEMSEDPDLVRRRGLRPGEPLPKSLGLFDENGMPLERQNRESWLKLRHWLDDDDAVLEFFFPEGLAPQDETVLRGDLAILKQQPWSPQAFVQATLDAWPSDGSDLDFSYARMEQDMLEACEKFLADTEAYSGAEQQPSASKQPN